MTFRRDLRRSVFGFLLWTLLGIVPLIHAQEPVDWETLLIDYGKETTQVGAVPDELPEPDWEIGDRRVFYVIATDKAETLTVDAELIWLGENFAVWLDSDVRRPVSDSIRAGFADFDLRVIDLMRSIFGSEASPGVDNDPRLHALFTDKLALGVLGYFSSRDTVSPNVSPFSNGMELFMLNDVLLTASGERVVNTLSHEFQHMIHYNQDGNEGSNFDEGFSGFAEELTGKRFSDGTETAFYRQPDTPLSWWKVSPSVLASYGASYLFTKYVADQMGLGFLKPWGEAQANQFDGLDEALQSVGADISADELYASWLGENLRAAIAGASTTKVWRDGESFGKSALRAVDVTELTCDAGTITEEVLSYGGRYFRLNRERGQAELTVSFGSEMPLFSMIGADETAAFYASGTTNNSLLSMKRTFDLTKAGAQVALSFRIATDLETDFDYLYLLSSTDGEKSWTQLQLPGGSDQNLSGFNLGNGLTGSSGGWRDVSLDLSSFAGKQVVLRFDVITDQAVTGEGVLLKDFRLSDAMGLSVSADDGWEMMGWSRYESNRTPVSFAFVSIESNPNEKDAAVETSFPESGVPITMHCNFNDASASFCGFALAGLNRQSRSPGQFTVQVSCSD